MNEKPSRAICSLHTPNKNKAAKKSKQTVLNDKSSVISAHLQNRCLRLATVWHLGGFWPALSLRHLYRRRRRRNTSETSKYSHSKYCENHIRFASKSSRISGKFLPHWRTCPGNECLPYPIAFDRHLHSCIRTTLKDANAENFQAKNAEHKNLILELKPKPW